MAKKSSDTKGSDMTRRGLAPLCPLESGKKINFKFPIVTDKAD